MIHKNLYNGVPRHEDKGARLSWTGGYTWTWADTHCNVKHANWKDLIVPADMYKSNQITNAIEPTFPILLVQAEW